MVGGDNKKNKKKGNKVPKKNLEARIDVDKMGK